MNEYLKKIIEVYPLYKKEVRDFFLKTFKFPLMPGEKDLDVDFSKKANEKFKLKGELSFGNESFTIIYRVYNYSNIYYLVSTETGENNSSITDKFIYKREGKRTSKRNYKNFSTRAY